MEDNIIPFPPKNTTKNTTKNNAKLKSSIPVSEHVDTLMRKLAETELLRRENAELIKEITELRKQKKNLA
jgi:hypothetical protein